MLIKQNYTVENLGSEQEKLKKLSDYKKFRDSISRNTYFLIIKSIINFFIAFMMNSSKIWGKSISIN